jgi:hypothetical protein
MSEQSCLEPFIEVVMKSMIVSIASCDVLIAGSQCAYAQRSAHKIHPSSPPTGGFADMSVTAAVVADGLVLPLVGMSDHIEGRLAFVKTELKNTAAQMPLWDAFDTATRANAARENEMIARESSDFTSDRACPDLPQRLQAHGVDPGLRTCRKHYPRFVCSGVTRRYEIFVGIRRMNLDREPFCHIQELQEHGETGEPSG